MEERTPLVSTAPTSTSNVKLYLAVFSAILGNFNFGYSMVYPSPVIPYFENADNPNLRMDNSQIGWFGSVFALGAIGGGLGAMLLNETVGRKVNIMMSAVPSAVGYLVMGAAQAVWMLYLGRFLTGLAGGMTAAAIPVYVSEISSPTLRGRLGSTPQITTVIGSLVLYALGLRLSWRWLAIAGEGPAVLMLVLLCFMPESPRYLIAKGRHEDAQRVLEWLRGKGSNFMSEFISIEKSVASKTRMSLLEVINESSYRKPILIAVTMRFLQQMTGITPIVVYLQPIFHRTKVSLEPKYDAALGGGIRLLSVLISGSLMDKVGRKRLLYASGFLMFLANQSMTLYTITTSDSRHNITGLPLDSRIQKTSILNPLMLLPLFSMMLNIFGYAMGWGPIAWLLMSEILPLKARGWASGLCVVVTWLTAFLLTKYFMVIVEDYGLFVPFLFFDVICVLSIVFTALYVPETKGRPLEEIESYFRTGKCFSCSSS